MKILVACEESQAVTIELRKLGHEAYSCDIEPCSGGHPEWHIQGDVTGLINGRCRFQTVDGSWHEVSGKWDMLIAFPPCTYLSNAGARHLWRGGKLNNSRYQKGLRAKAFFMSFYNADCSKIVIENPISSRIYKMPKHTQTIQPYQFGHAVRKTTRLWLKGLPNLTPTNIVDCKQNFLPSGNYSGGHDPIYAGYERSKKSKDRSKTFPGIAKAMAEQWAGKAEEI